MRKGGPVEAEEQAQQQDSHGPIIGNLGFDALTILAPIKNSYGQVRDFEIEDAQNDSKLIFGGTRDSLIGKKLGVQFPEVFNNGFFELCETVWRTGEPRSIEMKSVLLEVNADWLRIRLVPVGPRVAVICEALSESQRHGERLAAFITALPEDRRNLIAKMLPPESAELVKKTNAYERWERLFVSYGILRGSNVVCPNECVLELKFRDKFEFVVWPNAAEGSSVSTWDGGLKLRQGKAEVFYPWRELVSAALRPNPRLNVAAPD